MRAPRKPTKPLPPVRVELPLYDALNELAQAQGRSLSSVVRSILREAMDSLRWEQNGKT